MIYGKEKTRQMVRSILPSKARKAAKHRKDCLHRENRRKSALQLTTLRGPATYVIDEFEDIGDDLTYWIEPKDSDGGWDTIVSDRREADKLNHFELWAYKKTKHLSVDERFKKMESLVPNNLIGQHALSHLDFFKPPTENRRWWMRDQEDEYWSLPGRLRMRRYRYNYTPSAYLLAGQAFDAAVHKIKHNDVQRRKFNKYLKDNPWMVQVGQKENTRSRTVDGVIKLYATYTPIYEDQTRTLNGYHDAVKFIKEIKKQHYYHAAAFFNIEIPSRYPGR
jgi:hypothetical protein